MLFDTFLIVLSTRNQGKPHLHVIAVHGHVEDYRKAAIGGAGNNDASDFCSYAPSLLDSSGAYAVCLVLSLAKIYYDRQKGGIYISCVSCVRLAVFLLHYLLFF